MFLLTLKICAQVGTILLKFKEIIRNARKLVKVTKQTLQIIAIVHCKHKHVDLGEFNVEYIEKFDVLRTVY